MTYITNKTVTPVSHTPGVSGTATLDMSEGTTHFITMPEGNITIAVSNVQIGQFFMVRILQDATGGRTVTWFNTIKWENGTTPTLTTTGSKADSFIFNVTAADNYDGYIAGQNI